MHCGIDPVEKDGVVTNIGYAGVAAYKAEMEAQYGEDNVTLVDAGDAIQGGNIGTVSKGAYLVDIMNKMGYDLAIPGNHEFDYGMDNFLDLAKNAEYTYLCCNFTDLEGKPVFDSYKVLTYGDVKVAYVGIDTPETFTKSTPTYFQNEAGEFIYSFAEKNNGKDLYAAVQKAVDAAKKDGADYVVALGHLGDNGSAEEWKAQTVIANTTGIDVFIDGHSHEQIEKTVANKDGKDVVWAQTGTKLAALGKVVIDTESGEITHELVSPADAAQQDEEVASFVASIQAQFQDEMNKVVATSEVELTTKDADGKRLVRSGEANLGDLCADAYRAVGEADIGLMNGGGIRADIKAGEITMGDILDVYTFGNEVCLAEITGQQLLEALEMGARNYPDENGGFLHVSGVTYTINAGIPSPVVTDEAKMFVKLEGANRVTDVTVGGEPLDLEKTYTVCSHNYMLQDGGDGFAMFGKNINVLRPGMMVDNAGLVQYIVDNLGGKVTAEQYSKPQGRIIIKAKTGVASIFSDVEASDSFVEAVQYVYDKGLMTGTDKGFEPLMEVNNTQALTILWNLSGKTKADTTVSGVEGKWYAGAVNWAASMDLIEGNGFEEKSVTCGEVLDLFTAYGQKTNQDFSGLTEGDQNESIDLNSVLTRAQLAQLLLNASDSAK